MARSTKEKSSGRSGRVESRPAPPRSHKTKAALELERQERERQQQEFRRKCRITSVVLFAVCVLFLALILFGGISPAANELIYGMLGWSAYVWVAVGFSVSVVLALERPENSIKSKVVLFLLAGAMLSTFIHLVSPVSKEVDGYSIAKTMQTMFYEGQHGDGAGALGGMLGALFAAIFGRGMSILLLALGTFVFVMIVSGSDIIRLFKGVAKPVQKASVRAAESMERAAEQYRIIQEERREERRRRAAFVDVPIDDEEPEEVEEVPVEQPRRSRRKKTVQEEPDYSSGNAPEESGGDDEELSPLEEIRRATENTGKRSSAGKKTAAKKAPDPEPQIDEDVAAVGK